MKALKRLPALLLCAACLTAPLAAAAGAAAPVSTFPDIADPVVGQAVESLRIMGVLQGDPDGTFRPGDTLSRAEFCKMAILVMQLEGGVAAQETRTIFTDVTSTHWARGYVNLAVNTEVDGSRLILGMGDGSFSPDTSIPYEQAVTILLRMLGYGREANSNWPSSAISQARTLKLDRDLGAVQTGRPLTRGQAAVLFCNALELDPGLAKGSSESAILLSCSDTAADGSPAVLLARAGQASPVKLRSAAPASFFQGLRGTAVLDGQGLLLTFLPDREGSRRSFTAAGASAGGFTAVDGTRVPIPSGASVWRDGAVDTYGRIFPGLDRPGLGVTVYYTAAGAVDYVYVAGVEAISGRAMVAAGDGYGAFDAITGGSRTCAVVKNGSAAAQTDLKRYDVGIYDQSTDTLYVTDFRLSGAYTSARPNAAAPTHITVLGREFELLDCALESLSERKLGDAVTLLFSPDGKVAGVMAVSELGANALGVADPEESTGDRVTIDLFNAPAGLERISGALSSSVRAESYLGAVVSVSGGAVRSGGVTTDVLYLSRQYSRGNGELDISARTVGGVPMADTAVILEKVGGSALTRITLADLPGTRVAASKVTYQHLDYAGRVDILILDDVTGDCYAYGLVSEAQEVTEAGTVFGDIKNTVTTVDNGAEKVKVVGSYDFPFEFGGVAPSLEKLGDIPRSAGFMPLNEIANVSPGSFDLAAGRFSGGPVTLPIAEGVRCYDRTTGSWFSSLEECLSLSSRFTVYYDRTPAEGGKVRIVVAG